MRFIERCIGLQACWQVWVGNEWHTECDSIGFTRSDPGIGAVFCEALIDDVRAAKGCLELRAEEERKEATLETYAKEKEELNHSFKTFLEVNSQKQKAGMVLSASSFLIMVIVLLSTFL